jgi:hypothetical protein
MRRVQFDGMDVAVVPVEFMLASSDLEGNQQATNRILHALRTASYDAETLQRALSMLPSERAMRLLRLLEIRLVAG